MNNRKRILAPWARKAMPDAPEDADAGKMQQYLAEFKGKPALYHCVSRVVDKRKIFGFAEKEKFVLYMREYEAFCQVRILTYCVMANHFHILVEVPEPPEDRGKSWSDERFLEHMKTRYHDAEWLAIAMKLNGYREKGQHRKAEEYRDKFFARMWDLSWFLRLLKQRFAQWYNYRGKPEPGKRDGYLWSDRFRSIIVENGRAARTMAAYIDLNPVRAGIVEDPADYRWSGYGEAMAGAHRAREGLRLVVFEFYAEILGEEMAAESTSRWSDAAATYRWMMFLDGEENFRNLAKGRAGIPHAKVLRALAESGEFDEFELGMHRERMRQFTEAMAMGGEEFVDAVHAAGRGRGKPPKLRERRGEPEPKKGTGSKVPKRVGWLRFLRGSRKETAEA